MRKKDLPEIIFFEEKAGSNGIHCLDYKNSSNIKYIREDVVKNIFSKPMLSDDTITLTKDELETFLQDWDQGYGSWSDTSRRIVRFLGMDETDGL